MFFQLFFLNFSLGYATKKVLKYILNTTVCFIFYLCFWCLLGVKWRQKTSSKWHCGQCWVIKYEISNNVTKCNKINVKGFKNKKNSNFWPFLAKNGTFCEMFTEMTQNLKIWVILEGFMKKNIKKIDTYFGNHVHQNA